MNKQVLDSKQKKSFHKFYQSYWMYFLVCICEIVTIMFDLFPVYIHNQQTIDLLFTVTGVLRIAIFLFSSINLIGFHFSLIRIYFLVDNHQLLVLSTSITYVVYNYNGEEVLFKYPALIVYPLVIFIMTGNFRVMLIYCKWDRWQIIFFKLLQLFGSVFYFVYGSYQTKNKNIEQPQLFLLFVFTTFSYYSQMFFGMNKIDDSEKLNPDYTIIAQKIESKRLVTKKLIEMNSFLD